jgi:hypothetical protein
MHPSTNEKKQECWRMMKVGRERGERRKGRGKG